MERERKEFYEKLISYCIFLIIKKALHYMFGKFFYLNSSACNLQPTVSILRHTARVACAILAHAASHMTFHGYFEFTFTKQYSEKFFRS